ncbi:hypothetical protein p2A397 (plasmid) [Aromatoleum aromaticum EbN1]|uniref:Photosynthesis system II assembly factor Ycf48/Hcf136-like domain-containing protein n=1 Tax=Aromatoleum aromaticum (strain DSM 19018 / LMG 30748 / EbN1) TaxID=76114 RepID=Q5NW47_AROAE|nr:YCF48-related protein [Aromatoleum aromaticum]CAI10717.1 hypothetical protein p2A397 [Aromatoleum aromaticum EbN1]
MKKLLDLILSGAPLAIVGGLAYAGIFIKPQPQGSAVEQPVFERGEGYYGVSVLDQGKAWVVGSNGKIAVTEDGGASWQKQATPSRAALQDVAAWDDQHAVAVGNDGIVLITVDAGRSWQSVDAPKSEVANKLLRVKALPGGTAWAVGEAGMVMRSTDFGRSWTRVGGDEDVGWNDIVATGGRIWLVGEFGNVKVSGDDGVSWRAIETPVETSLMGLAFKDAENGVTVGLGGVVLTTRDGGQSWEQQQTPSSEHLFSVLWEGSRWIAAGASGVILVGGDEGRRWKETRLSELDRNWYTGLARQGDKYFFSGSQVAVVGATAL